MKQKYLLGFVIVAAIFISLIGIFRENFYLEKMGEALFFIPLLGYHFNRVQKRNLNFYAFLACVAAAIGFSFLQQRWYFDHLILGFWLASYIFLVREAIKHTEYERGSRFTTVYFVVIVALYAYLLFFHILEIGRSLSNTFSFSLYLIYYLNIFFFAVTALVYYLNSFSRKSVFFICLTLAFIFGDVLRDMEVFYFRDLSVEIIRTLIRFAGIKLAFLFFVTREKKLRLLHLV